MVCHGFVLGTASDATYNLASRRSSFLALDALENDPEFMTRVCYCRALSDARKAAKRQNNTKNQLDKDSGGSRVREQADIDEQLDVEGLLGADDDASDED